MKRWRGKNGAAVIRPSKRPRGLAVPGALEQLVASKQQAAGAEQSLSPRCRAPPPASTFPSSRHLPAVSEGGSHVRGAAN